AGAAVNSAATATAAAELHPRFVIICTPPFSSAARGRIYPTFNPRRRRSVGGGLRSVFGLADVLGPVRALTLLAGFRHRQMREQAVGGRTMPVHRIRRDHDRVTGIDRLRPRALADADAADAGEAIQRLAHRVGMPAGACA